MIQSSSVLLLAFWCHSSQVVPYDFMTLKSSSLSFLMPCLNKALSVDETQTLK